MSKDKEPIPDIPFDFADAREAHRGADGRTYFNPPVGKKSKRGKRLHLLPGDATDAEISEVVRRIKGKK